jgi:CRP/FNR family transcriptional regulator
MNANIQNSSLFSSDNFHKLSGMMSRVKVPSSTNLFWEGDRADKLYFLFQGNAKATKSTKDGKEVVFYLFHEGDLFGLCEMYSDAKLSFSAVTTGECELGVIQKEELEAEMCQSGSLAVEFMQWMGQMHRLTQTKLRDLLLYGKPGALCSTLIRLANTYGEAHPQGTLIRHKVTNTELGDYIGSARESVNRMLHDLKKAAAVDWHNGYLLIKDIGYLKKICCCEDCPISVCRM